MKCYMCGMYYAPHLSEGLTTKITLYEERQNRLTKKWRIVKKPRKIFICKKCNDMLHAVVLNYRKNSR